jgi:hypothetical protein
MRTAAAWRCMHNSEHTGETVGSQFESSAFIFEVLAVSSAMRELTHNLFRVL